MVHPLEDSSVFFHSSPIRCQSNIEDKPQEIYLSRSIPRYIETAQVHLTQSKMASENETLESVLAELGMELPEDPIEVCIEIDVLSYTHYGL